MSREGGNNVGAGALKKLSRVRLPRVATIHPSVAVVTEREALIREKVDAAIMNRQVFAMNYRNNVIERELKARGWLQVKKEVKNSSWSRGRVVGTTGSSSGPSNHFMNRTFEQLAPETDDEIISRLLKRLRAEPNFVWTMDRPMMSWKCLPEDQFISKLPYGIFTTKSGLCQSLQRWEDAEDGDADYFFPRCYVLNTQKGCDDFQNDFRMTACFNLLKWLVENADAKREIVLKKSLVSNYGYYNKPKKAQMGISKYAIKFALARSHEYLRMQENEDIDFPYRSAKEMKSDWEEYLSAYYKIVHERKKFQYMTSGTYQRLLSDARKTLEEVRVYWLQLETDGMENLWIVKPAAKSRGQGIFITKRMDKVMEFSFFRPGESQHYVVQKYIEKPMLIYKTKFDIRQWFMITNLKPLVLWIYRACYVRFCSNPFTLSDLHESVHLCNNAIQYKYQNTHYKNLLPDQHMWDSETFKRSLRSMGYTDAWEKIIYPGIKRAIIGAVLASRQGINYKKNSFELYGADFILGEDLQPWLMEINSKPCMMSTTNVTSQLCPQCYEDIIKVVIDGHHHKDGTGMFELAYGHPNDFKPPTLRRKQQARKTVRKCNTRDKRPPFKEMTAGCTGVAPTSAPAHVTKSSDVNRAVTQTSRILSTRPKDTSVTSTSKQSLTESDSNERLMAFMQSRGMPTSSVINCGTRPKTNGKKPSVDLPPYWKVAADPIMKNVISAKKKAPLIPSVNCKLSPKKFPGQQAAFPTASAKLPKSEDRVIFVKKSNGNCGVLRGRSKQLRQGSRNNDVVFVSVARAETSVWDEATANDATWSNL